MHARQWLRQQFHRLRLVSRAEAREIARAWCEENEALWLEPINVGWCPLSPLRWHVSVGAMYRPPPAFLEISILTGRVTWGSTPER